MTNPLTENDNGIRIIVRAFPGAKKNQIAGLWHGEAMKIMLNAPAVDGKANKALVAYLAEFLHTKKSRIEILSGETAHNKIIFIQTDSATQRAEFMALLSAKIATEAM